MSEVSRFANLRGRSRAGSAGQDDVSLSALVASMSDDDKVELRAALGIEASDDGDDDDAAPPAPKGKKKKDDKEPEANSAAPQVSAEREAAIRAEERARMSAVFASEHVNGRAHAAVELLASTDLAADKIVAMLPKLGASAAEGDGAAEILAAMQGNNPDLTNDGGSSAGGGVGQANHGWGKIAAKINASRKR